MARITVIKARKRTDMWDYFSNKPIEDKDPIGLVIEVEGAVPESFIKYEPNRIFDKRKYPELYTLFGKEHLPNELELKCFIEKHKNIWFPKKSSLLLKISLTIIILFVISIVGLIIYQ